MAYDSDIPYLQDYLVKVACGLTTRRCKWRPADPTVYMSTLLLIIEINKSQVAVDYGLINQSLVAC